MKLTKRQIDKKILDHAEKIVKLMRLKGFDGNTSECDSLFIWIIDEKLQVEAINQKIKTNFRKIR